MKAGIYLEEYKGQLNLFGGYRQETLNMETFQKLIDKKADLLRKQKKEETNMLNIFGRLQNEMHKN